MRYRMLLLLVLMLGLSMGGVIRAQDTASVDAPTDVPTDIPTEIATDVPTDIPTEVATDVPTDVATDTPTDIPTDVATEVATDAATDIPTEVATEEVTETATPEPTVAVNLPPQFSLDGSSALDATAGLQTTFTLSVADEDGLVTVGRADTTSIATIVVTQATEAVAAEARFYTAVTIDYTAPADFVGADSFTLVAVDTANLSTTLTLTVNVVLPEVTPEATLEPTPEPTALPDQVGIINYNPAASEKSIQAMLSALGAVEISRIPQIGAMKVRIPKGVSSAPAFGNSMMSANPDARAAGVISIEPDIIYQTAAFPNDTLYPPTGGESTSNQWALTETTAGSMAVNFAWGISVKDGTGIIVAVLDTGIDTTHPDLTGKFVPGWNFVADIANTDDDNGHGTELAGIIAANTNNAKGIAGVAFNAKLMPVKVCDAAKNCSSYDIAAGFVFAVDKGAKIVNFSLGGTTESTTIKGAVQYAISKNVTIVAAAGNTGTTTEFYPASYDGVISVAAHDIDGNHAAFSTTNNHVVVSAPGVGIISTVPLENATCTVDVDPPGAGPEDFALPDGYCVDSGTSMAAAQVTGIVALMLSDKVVSTPAAAKEALICSAFDSASDGKDPEFGYGLVQADMAQNWNENSGLCKVTAPNDLYQNAINIATVPYSTVQAIHSRSVTSSPSDPSNATSLLYCDAPEQSLWYKFKPTISDYYQISTIGSDYDTQLSVWQLPEEGNTSTNFIGCNDESFSLPPPFGNASMLNVALTAGQTYYIMVDSFDIADDAVLHLDVRRSMFNNNVDYQENSPNIAYVGTWLQTAAAGASGGQVKTTTDIEAMAVFTFRGVGLDIFRTVGPTQADMIVLVDDNPEGILINKTAVLKRNQVTHIDLLCSCNTPGKWHQVVLVGVGETGSMDIDRIRTYDAEELPTASITALTDDSLGGTYPCAARKFCYTGGAFTPVMVTGANLGKVTEITDPYASVSFRATGSNITIFRTTGPSYGTMDIQVDGDLVATVSNDSTTGIHAKVPYVISGLGVYSHVVQIINNAGGTLQFDAAMASTPAAIAATPATLTNENAATLTYSGFWMNIPTPGASGNTVREAAPQPTEEHPSVSFKFTGNWFTIGYRKTTPGATVDVYVDDMSIPLATITDLGGPPVTTTWGDYSTFKLSDRTHTVRLVVTGGTFQLDSIGARRQTIITPTMGVVQETNPALSYDTVTAAWTTTTAKSLGGYAFQGNTAKHATGGSANLTFYVNGSGFILYTSVGPSQDAWEVYVDGVLFPNLTLNGAPITDIDLHTGQLRFRPFAYGITGLGSGITGLEAGIHKIQLVKHSASGSIDFDAVRVFP